MEANFTPGPLERNKYGNVLDATGQTVRVKGFSLSMCLDGEADANATLVAAAPELYEALTELLMFFKSPEESENDRFERIGDAFYRDTLMLRPGKSEPIEVYYEGRDEERQERFDKWCVEKVERARVTLAKARGEEA